MKTDEPSDRELLSEISGIPLRAISANATIDRFAVDLSVIDGESLQIGVRKLASAFSRHGRKLFLHKMAKDAPAGGFGTWQHYSVRTP